MLGTGPAGEVAMRPPWLCSGFRRSAVLWAHGLSWTALHKSMPA